MGTIHVLYQLRQAYHIAGNFREVQFLQTGAFQNLRIQIHGHVQSCQYVHYKRAYFAGLISMVSRSTTKSMKIGPLKNFPLYAIYPDMLHHSCTHTIPVDV